MQDRNADDEGDSVGDGSVQVERGQQTEAISDGLIEETATAYIGRFKMMVEDLVRDHNSQRPLDEAGVIRIMQAVKRNGLRRLQNPLAALARVGDLDTTGLSERSQTALNEDKKLTKEMSLEASKSIVSANQKFLLVAGQHRAAAIKKLCEDQCILDDVDEGQYQLTEEDVWWWVDVYDSGK